VPKKAAIYKVDKKGRRMKKNISHLLSSLFLGCSLLISGCANGPDSANKNPVVSPGNSSLLKSSLGRAPVTNVPDADVSTLVSGNSDFAFDLYAQIRAQSGNLACSPYSI
jgi:serpin B